MLTLKNKCCDGRAIKRSSGFTIVELLVVIVIIAILSIVAIIAYNGIQHKAVITSLQSDLASASKQLKLYQLEKQNYPTNVNDCPIPAAGNMCLKSSPGNTFGIPLVSNIAFNAQTFCVDITNAASNTSYHSTDGTGPQEGPCTIPAPSSPSSSVASSTSANLSWGAVDGAISYTIQRDTNSNFTNPETIATQSGTIFTATGLLQGVTYYFRVQATTSSGTSDWVIFASITTPIDTPALAPTVSSNTTLTTTNFFWSVTSCPTGTTARYQYRYTISPSGFDSGWTSTNLISVSFSTTAEGQTYTVQLQTQCYTTAATSGWSGIGSTNYYRSGSWKQIAIENGGQFMCGIASNDKAYCWGQNTGGQIGDNSLTERHVPTPVYTDGVLSGKTMKSIVVGAGYACAIASDNQAYCWGYGSSGELGNNAFSNSSVPVAVYTGGVLSGKTIKALSAGESSTTCAIASDDKAYCWGSSNSGRLGNNDATGTNMSVPVAVISSGSLSGKAVTSITTGDAHTCVTVSPNVGYHCWGMTSQGQFGNNTTTSQNLVPVAVATSGALAGKTVSQLSAGKSHTCAIASDNNAYCWGNHYSGQVGSNATPVYGSTEQYNVPVAVYTGGVLSGKTIKKISAGQANTCVIASDDKPYCWGKGTYGANGNNSTTQANGPVAVDMNGVLLGKTVKSIMSADMISCAIASDDQLYCWGYNHKGQLGNNTVDMSTVPVATLPPF